MVPSQRSEVCYKMFLSHRSVLQNVCHTQAKHVTTRSVATKDVIRCFCHLQVCYKMPLSPRSEFQHVSVTTKYVPNCFCDNEVCSKTFLSQLSCMLQVGLATARCVTRRLRLKKVCYQISLSQRSFMLQAVSVTHNGIYYIGDYIQVHRRRDHGQIEVGGVLVAQHGVPVRHLARIEADLQGLFGTEREVAPGCCIDVACRCQCRCALYSYSSPMA